MPSLHHITGRKAFKVAHLEHEDPPEDFKLIQDAKYLAALKDLASLRLNAAGLEALANSPSISVKLRFAKSFNAIVHTSFQLSERTHTAFLTNCSFLQPGPCRHFRFAKRRPRRLI